MEGPGQFSDFTLDPKARGEVSGRDGTDQRKDSGVSEPGVYDEFFHKEEQTSTPNSLCAAPFPILTIKKNIANILKIQLTKTLPGTVA